MTATAVDLDTIERLIGSLPKERIEHLASLPGVRERIGATCELTIRQVEADDLLESDATHCMLFGGSRSGKTFLIVRKIVARALRCTSRHAIMRFRFSHVVTSVALDTLPKVMRLCFPGVADQCKLDKSLWTYHLPNGSSIWFGGLDEKERTEKILGQEYCLDPDAVVLMADLTWRRADDVRKGDEIVAFPESLEGHTKLVRSRVEYNDPIVKKRYRVVTNKGETIVSEGHKFVAYFDDRRVRNFRPLSWRKVEDLSPGDKLRFAAAPWTTDKSYDGGWIAGLYDGEGWLNGDLGLAQNPGLVLERAKRVLVDRGIEFREHVSSGKCVQVCMAGLWQAMRAIGMLRPVRLLEKAHLLWENRRGFNGHGDAVGSMSQHAIRTDARHVAEILSIEELPKGLVRAIQTSSKTLISDGFLSHNCSIFLNECSQIPLDSRDIAITRLAQNTELARKMYYDCNPPSKRHWTHLLFIDKIDPARNQPLTTPENYAAMQINPGHNRKNLPAEYLKDLDNLDERKRRRFLLGIFSDDDETALWTPEMLDKGRLLEKEPPPMQRVIIAVDPSGCSGPEDFRSDEIGIVVVGLGDDGKGYVLEDLSGRFAPDRWKNIVASAFERHEADAVVAEVNYGGAMVREVMRTATVSQLPIPFREVHASRGKSVRAEPIAALFEQGKVSLVGRFQELEHQLCAFTVSGWTGQRSPDRADAMIWGLTEIFPAMARMGRSHHRQPKIILGYASAKRGRLNG